MSKPDSLQDALDQAIKERDQALAAYERENAEYREFLYVASHDLNAPLRKIKAFCERLQMHAGAQLDEKANHYLDRMQVATDRMQAMLDGLLILSRVNSRDLAPEPIVLHSLLDGLVAKLKAELEVADAQVQLDVGEYAVSCDPYQLNALFTELLKNALQYPREGQLPEVEVAAREGEAGRLEITVTDQGRGFDENGLDMMFSMFQRLHRPEDDESGCGAGLTVCKRIVERHGGRIAASGAPGRGARFHFTLPAA